MNVVTHIRTKPSVVNQVNNRLKFYFDFKLNVLIKAGLDAKFLGQRRPVICLVVCCIDENSKLIAFCHGFYK